MLGSESRSPTPEFRPPSRESSSTKIDISSPRRRNPNWQEWYPPVPPKFEGVEIGKSLYGEPNQETLNLFSELPIGANVLDVGGGDGRYAIPLAMMGHNVTVFDVDEAHLERLEDNAAFLPEDAGRIKPLYADATKEYPVKDKFDAVLSAGFAYLMPPDQLEPVFARMAEAVKPNGSLVVEFATDRVRRDKEGNLLIGGEEHSYTLQVGREILKKLYGESGLELHPTQEKEINLNTSFYDLNANLIIAHGNKNSNNVNSEI